MARGCDVAFPSARINAPFCGLVSNMIEGPPLPRASKFSATSTSFAHGCSATNARAPSRPVSSESVNRKMMSFSNCSPLARRARAVSSKVATPVPSSFAPGPVETES